MKYDTLGSTGIEVSEVGFGAWVVGTDWWGDRTRDQAIEMVQHAVDRDVTFFDTGDVYGHGDSEELVGEALAEVRDEVTVSTKVGYDFYNNPQAGHGELPKKVTPEWIRTALDRSLDRLDMDHVELLMLHNANVDEVTPDVLETLDELREEGKVEAIGWALGPSIGWLADGDAAVANEFDALQTVFNLFEQTPGQHFIDTIRERNADTSVLARVPHSSGLLNEQVTPETEFEADDHRAHRPTEWYETGFEKLETLRFLERAERSSADGSSGDEPRERDGERTMGQAAIQWLLAHDEVASVTPTFRTNADIDEWAGAPDTPPLSEAEYDRVQSLYADNFGVDRDDGMDALRSSVGGEDLDGTGMKSAGD
ncbi:aldo/keto reductase [Haloarcula sp. S1CR25-12]|uniref:Aldo/keto reductase n=1 Tax=Haloarcula saliterrae TaxID=2950534 RepID=A0ABU2FCN4_9EURY|nr:aldo/keto reductase [Haloarcula sp. S1CR25-12]MDS0260014.1 aldo/keto reductase [Haloarcula sp. S1CR25-12]